MRVTEQSQTGRSTEGRTRLRVLGRTRISRSTDESTSLLRQREVIQRWAEDNGHEIVGWAEDDGVSGSVDPWDAPALGPWLEDYSSWDVLCAWKMDRVSRRTVPLHRLFGFMQEHSKTLVCVSDGIDLSTLAGRMVATVIAYVAEGELEAIRERTTASKKKLRELGRLSGGKAPYGYRKIPAEGGGWVLEIDPETGPILRGIVDDLLAGVTSQKIAADLRERGILSPTGKAFNSTTVRYLAHSPALMGYSTHKGKTVRDAEGEPVRVSQEGIASPMEFDQLQRVMDTRTAPKKRVNASPLLGVVFCYDCGEAMHYAVNRANRGGGKGMRVDRYYRCRYRCCPGIKAEELETFTYDLFLGELGDSSELVKVETLPVDNTLRIAELNQTIQDLASTLGALGSETATKAITDRITALDKEVQELTKAQDASGRVTWESTGVTYRDLFESADSEGKRQIMLKAGIRVDAKKMHKAFTVPEELLERLGKGSQASPGPSEETSTRARALTVAMTQGKGHE